VIRIACVGDNCVDVYDGTGESYPGGNPVNVAVYIRRLGGSASYIGAVGGDAGGRMLLSALGERGVDVCRVRVLPGATAVTHVSRVNGERIFGEYDEGVTADFRPSPEDVEFMCSHDLVVSGIWGHAEGCFGELRRRGIPVAFDCSEYPEDAVSAAALKNTDIAFFSDDVSDDAALRGRIRAAAALGPAIVAATRGGRGSLVFDGENFHEGGITPCAVADTMGAGDSFIAGFLYARLGGADIPACIRAGSDCSAVTLGYYGAW
jgi:fructoselysine 6-kinase